MQFIPLKPLEPFGISPYGSNYPVLWVTSDFQANFKVNLGQFDPKNSHIQSRFAEKWEDISS